MTPEEEEQLRQFRLGRSARLRRSAQSDATQEQQPGFFDPGGFGYEYLGPRLGETVGGFLGAQKYGTGRSAEGDIAGRPLNENTLAGQTATLGATGLEFLGDAARGAQTTSGLLGQGAEYLTGLNIVEGGPVSAPATQPTMQQAAELPTVDAVATDTQPEPVVLQSPAAREADPIRSTLTLPSGEVVMERQSGERFTPTSDQLESFSSVMQDLGQPSNEQAPMSMAETRSMLQERFGAPTISAIQALPAGQGLGLPTDAQGRMITPGAQPPATALSDFEQASLERQQRIGGTGSFEGDSAAREERLAERDRRPGETRTERDTRIARSRTEGARAGALTMADAVDLAGGDRTLARTMVVRSRRGLDPMTGKEQFVPREVTIEGNRYIQLTPEYFQPVAQDTPEETRLEQTLKNLEADLASGRLTQGEYDIAVQNAKDVYIGLDKKAPSKTQEGEVEGVIQQTIAEGESQPDSIPTITSQEEYDKLPKGSRYIDSKGKSAIKR